MKSHQQAHTRMKIAAAQASGFNEIQLRDINEDISIPGWCISKSGNINKKIYDANMMPLIF